MAKPLRAFIHCRENYARSRLLTIWPAPVIRQAHDVRRLLRTAFDSAGACTQAPRILLCTDQFARVKIAMLSLEDRSTPALSAAERDYSANRAISGELWRRACRAFPGGVSGAKYYSPYPIFIRSASGSQIVDVDGNHYIDLLMGVGPMLLGHGHPAVLRAIHKQLEEMTNPWMPTALSVRLAERICEHMPYLERLRFTNTGSEATRSAVRVARAATGRPLIAKCEGAFHGSDDMFLVSSHSQPSQGSDARPAAVLDYAGLVPGIERGVIVLPFNDAEAAAALIAEHAHELAAVLLEPVAFSTGGAVPATPRFASAIRDVTRRHDIVLIFDEVVTAYRLGLAGGPGYLGVTPDLSAIGKAIGGGMPLAAFGGSAALMESTLGLDAQDNEIFQSGTYTENPISMAAGLAALDVLEEDSILERADATGKMLRDGLVEVFAAHNIRAVVTGVASIAQIHIGATSVHNRRDVARADTAATSRFLLGMMAGGVLWPPTHPAVTSGAHTATDIEHVLATAERVLETSRP
jgi:glutamate-1-semialdehyde 2,1-aminomutase